MLQLMLASQLVHDLKHEEKNWSLFEKTSVVGPLTRARRAPTLPPRPALGTLVGVFEWQSLCINQFSGRITKAVSVVRGAVFFCFFRWGWLKEAICGEWARRFQGVAVFVCFSLVFAVVLLEASQGKRRHRILAKPKTHQQTKTLNEMPLTHPSKYDFWMNQIQKSCSKHASNQKKL